MMLPLATPHNSIGHVAADIRMVPMEKEKCFDLDIQL